MAGQFPIDGQQVRLCDDWTACTVPQQGFGRLVRLSIEGADLAAIWNDLMEKATDDAAGSGMGMDLSVIAQLRGNKDVGLDIQRDMLQLQRAFRIEREKASPRLRLLAFAAASDIGANTPVEFLLEASGIELAIYYIAPNAPLPRLLPDHDVAIVVAPCTPDGETTLAAVEAVSPYWPRPILNRPEKIRCLERDKLFHALAAIDGLKIPATMLVSRQGLSAIGDGECLLPEIFPETAFPIIVRPVGSHAGMGLCKIEHPEELSYYLRDRPEPDFFISPFIDFSGPDGLFRKYRLALIGGKPFASHMAVSDEWKVWYASAGMALSVEHRLEEGQFMQFFEEDFAARHFNALAAMSNRLGLDYVVIDCAETRQGDLLIFEADNTAIIHDLDPPNVFPYKHAHMQKLFAAFAGMLISRAGLAKTRAA